MPALAEALQGLGVAQPLQGQAGKLRGLIPHFSCTNKGFCPVQKMLILILWPFCACWCCQEGWKKELCPWCAAGQGSWWFCLKPCQESALCHRGAQKGSAQFHCSLKARLQTALSREKSQFTVITIFTVLELSREAG